MLMNFQQGTDNSIYKARVSPILFPEWLIYFSDTFQNELKQIETYYGPARADPLYEIRIWEAYAFLRDECINWV